MIQDWTRRAKRIEDVTIEIGFLVSPDFYFGPENRFTEEQWESMREPLYAPAADIYVPPPGRGCARYLLTQTVEQSPDELIAYYADVLRLIEKHRKKLIRERHYFEFHPILFSPGGEFELRWFYGASWGDAALTLQRLEQQEDGLLDDSIDQGWELEIVGEGNRLYIRVANPDAEPGEAVESDCVWCDRASIIRQIGPLRERTRRIRAALNAAFPVDYWSLRWMHPSGGGPSRSWIDELDAFGPTPPPAG
jgi:hypothetical protein